MALRASLEAVFVRPALECQFVPFLELDRRDVADRRVPTLRVVPALDELEDDRYGLCLRVQRLTGGQNG